MNENSKVVLEYSRRVFLDSVVVFQKRGYSGCSIWRTVTEDMGTDGNEMEIFPGIYAYMRKRKLFERIGTNWRDKDSIAFVVRNVRDKFDVINEKSPELSSARRCKIISTEEDIYPAVIEYPNALGGGSMKCGCPIAEYFHDLVYSGEYRIITESEIVEQTKTVPYFVRLCQRSKCFELLQDIKEHGYQKDENDMIQIEEINGKYIPNEGKHRICVMKRFGYDKTVPATVYHIGDSQGTSFCRVTYAPQKRYVDEYYDRFSRFGLDKKDVRKYLQDKNLNLCMMITEKMGLDKVYK